MLHSGLSKCQPLPLLAAASSSSPSRILLVGLLRAWCFSRPAFHREGTGLRSLVERSCTHLVRIPGNVDGSLGADTNTDAGEEGGNYSGNHDVISFLAVDSLNHHLRIWESRSAERQNIIVQQYQATSNSLIRAVPEMKSKNIFGWRELLTPVFNLVCQQIHMIGCSKQVIHYKWQHMSSQTEKGVGPMTKTLPLSPISRLGSIKMA
ncbi:hypothetical protein GUJ93_ZPchr0007g5346 [Zizania palustris]|uniref:Uncharacterized protein n=1 Tax=Zizania palustris TaxID=103762 RepID=A0A8J5VRC5_ZIZPA|nr:hypothetical protein GUJ93_ZPchr0007g5346 [Zizania palustris]